MQWIMNSVAIPGVKTVGTGNSYPGSPNLNLNLFTVQTDNGYVDKAVECYAIDENYITSLNIPVVRGRNFDNLSDTLHSILVNESMAKHFGWKEPIGKRVKFPGDTSGNYLEVVGVVKDFNQKSLYNPIAPLLLFYGPDGNIIQLKLNTSDLSKTIAQAGSIWKKYFPNCHLNINSLTRILIHNTLPIRSGGRYLLPFQYLRLSLPVSDCLALLHLPRNKSKKK